MKKQIKTPEKELNKMEISSLSDAEFKTLELSEDLSSIKKIQSETKDSLKSRMIYRETTLEWMTVRIKSMIWNIRKQKTTHQSNRIQKIEDSVRRLWDNFKHSNICIIEVPEGEEKEQEIGNLFEIIMKENFPNLVKDIDLQVQEAQRVPNNLDPKRSIPGHIIIKMPKVSDKR